MRSQSIEFPLAGKSPICKMEVMVLATNERAVRPKGIAIGIAKNEASIDPAVIPKEAIAIIWMIIAFFDWERILSKNV